MSEKKKEPNYVTTSVWGVTTGYGLMRVVGDNMREALKNTEAIIRETPPPTTDSTATDILKIELIGILYLKKGERGE